MLRRTRGSSGAVHFRDCADQAAARRRRGRARSPDRPLPEGCCVVLSRRSRIAFLSAVFAVAFPTYALGQLGGPASDQVIGVLEVDLGQVRRKATEVLGGMRPVSQQTVPALVNLLRHDEVQTRQTALRSLVRIGDPAKPAVPEILELMERETNETVRAQGHAALKKIDPRVRFSFDPP